MEAIKATESNEEEAVNILQKLDKEIPVPEDQIQSSFDVESVSEVLEEDPLDDTPSKIFVAGFDPTDTQDSTKHALLPTDVEAESAILSENIIPKHPEHVILDMNFSDAEDEIEEENQYGSFLTRLKEKFSYISEKCVQITSELNKVRIKLQDYWIPQETKSQPEEVLKNELREIEEMRRYTWMGSTETTPQIYQPYENFHPTTGYHYPLYIPTMRPNYIPSQLPSVYPTPGPKRQPFGSYISKKRRSKRLTQNLRNISSTYRNNLRAADSWKLDPPPRKCDLGKTGSTLSLDDYSSKSILHVRSDDKNKPLRKALHKVGDTQKQDTVVYKIDYSKYEKCIKESEKALQKAGEQGFGRTHPDTDLDSILEERQYGHFLGMVDRKSNDLLTKCNTMHDNLKRLKDSLEDCDPLPNFEEFGKSLHVDETPKQEDELVGEETGIETMIPTTTTTEKFHVSPATWRYQTSTPRFTPKPAYLEMKSDSWGITQKQDYPEMKSDSWDTKTKKELALDLGHGSDTDDEESQIEKTFGNSLKRIHDECENLRQKCNKSKKDLEGVRSWLNQTQQSGSMFEYHSFHSKSSNQLADKECPTFDEEDDEISHIKWKSDVKDDIQLDDSVDSAYLTGVSGRSTGYSARSRPLSGRSTRLTDRSLPSYSPFRDPTASLNTSLPLPRRRWEEDDEYKQTKINERPISFPKIETDRFKRLTRMSEQKNAPSLYLKTQTPVSMCQSSPLRYESQGNDVDEVTAMELELENEHGEFLDQCKTDFENICAKGLELRQEIRQLRFDHGISPRPSYLQKYSNTPLRKHEESITRKRSHRNFQPLEMNKTYKLRFPTFDSNFQHLVTEVSSTGARSKSDVNILYDNDFRNPESQTNHDEELSIEEQNYGDFLNSMKSSCNSLNERSARTRQEIRALRESIRLPSSYSDMTCGQSFRSQQHIYTMPTVLQGY